MDFTEKRERWVEGRLGKRSPLFDEFTRAIGYNGRSAVRLLPGVRPETIVIPIRRDAVI